MEDENFPLIAAHTIRVLRAVKEKRIIRNKQKREWVKLYIEDREKVPQINLRERLLTDVHAYR